MASRLVTRYLRREDEKTQKSKQLTSPGAGHAQGHLRGRYQPADCDRLNLSIKTVQSHRANIMEKLDLHNRVDLVKYAIRMGLATSEDSVEHQSS